MRSSSGAGSDTWSRTFAMRSAWRPSCTPAQPEVVFHLAAQAIVREGYAAPRETFETNVMGTVNLLEAVRACPSVRAVVIVTSDKCYENHETGRAYRETDAMGGRDPYSASKGCAELVTHAYRESFFAQGALVASVRAGNVIGGGDWAVDRLVPDAVRALTAGQPIVVRNPDAVRPWQHVLEPLSGYLQLAARLLDGDRAAGRCLELRARRFLRRPAGPLGGRALPRGLGSGTWTPAAGSAAEPHEAHRLSLDSTKARNELGWQPVWDVETAVRRTADWYREYDRAPANAPQPGPGSAPRLRDDARAAGHAWAGAREAGAAR